MSTSNEGTVEAWGPSCRYRVEAAGRTHVGRRSHNEDAMLLDEALGVFVVADGMGGYEGGEVASQVVVETVRRFFADNAGDAELTWPWGFEPGRSFVTNLLTVALRSGVPEVPLALLIAEEVALALMYVHSLADAQGRPLGLVHRDVSPSNVLLSKDGNVLLADFGIAKATKLATNTQAQIRRGKYAYMSPEQIAGAPLSSRSDQFGFGVMLHELLLGRRPYDGASPLETMDRIKEAAPVDLSALEADLGAIVGTCLARDPEERFETAEALQRALSSARRRREPASSIDLARWVREHDPQPSLARTTTRTMTD